MRLSQRFAPLLAALTLLLALPCGAASHTTKTAPDARVPVEERPFGAACRTAVEGSYVTAYCHNPYPEPDRVRLHIECDPWWDIDSDGVSVEAGPAQTVRLAGRCWKEVRSAWVSHQR
ncbi:hypothetical protein OHB35_39185 [Streptomyces phaeochromogenes]|uniref:Secreted protein n=1 Tax=Streptomyces phaeochromogenes TaxID=1923 RepID=A0ABZ1HMI5_STRPH|nr:hypothetical protein [Streptomyces phaeochromogenes]WSD18783.1 hypothetical protein OHB35_39185 [Streptomyces phaeochromogenes]